MFILKLVSIDVLKCEINNFEMFIIYVLNFSVEGKKHDGMLADSIIAR